MTKLVKSLGYPVEAFPSAADFLVSPSLAQTACLVTDVHMPGMTGVELHRVRDPDNAYPDDFVRDRALNDGVVCYLSKPVDDDHLERCLRSALKRRPPVLDPVARWSGHHGWERLVCAPSARAHR